MKEIYKTIKDYPNYEVSNEGSVRNRLTGCILKPNCKGGYQYVGLYLNGRPKSHYIHRLVATAFLPNPENKRTVNHINGIKTDNRVENLEWATDSENTKHAYSTGLSKSTDKNHFKANNPKPKQRARCVETKQEFESILDAAKYLGCRPATIHQSTYKGCRCKGYHFEFI